MQKIKQQLRTLYSYAALSAFNIAGASWVALLAVRGFSLVEIGLAESVFHLSSLLFEVPSGVAADVFGRRRALLISQCFAIVSAVAMLLSNEIGGVMIAMVFSALGYNFASGTREALAYESLKEAGQEDGYDRYASNEMVIYRISRSTATLCAGLALLIGYRAAYTVDVVLGLICLLLVLRLKESGAVQPTGHQPVLRRVGQCFAESLRFLKGNGAVMRLIVLNALVGAFATLLLFFLQARLTEVGLPGALLGPALFFMGMGGALGAKAVPLVKNWSYRGVWIVCAAGTLLCTGLAMVRLPLMMCLCGFLAAMFDDLIQVRSDVRLNGMVPSGQRATLISMSSLCFSLVMIFLSPALGWLFGL